MVTLEMPVRDYVEILKEYGEERHDRYNDDPPSYVITETEFGDYVGNGSVGVANHNWLLERFPWLDEERLSYGYHALCYTEDLLLDQSVEDLKELKDVLEGLANYPLIDDEYLSQAELERQDEAWESWVQSEIESVLEELLGDVDLDYTDAIDTRQIFETARESCNQYWIDEVGGAWIDTDPIKVEIREAFKPAMPEALEWSQMELQRILPEVEKRADWTNPECPWSNIETAIAEALKGMEEAYNG